MRLFFVGLCLSVASVVYIQSRHPQSSVTEGVSFAFNERQPTVSADGLRLISVGYPRLISNLLWLKFLQETPVKKVPSGELSWIYFDLDTITTVDPDFVPAFEHGGIFLSVVTEDRKGAELLLQKGIARFPERWRLRAYLAYHYEIELQDPEKAAPQYLAASRLEGAPAIMGILAARHLARKSSAAESISFLESLRESTKDKAMREKFTERIEFWKRKEKEKTP